MSSPSSSACSVLPLLCTGKTLKELEAELEEKKQILKKQKEAEAEQSAELAAIEEALSAKMVKAKKESKRKAKTAERKQVKEPRAQGTTKQGTSECIPSLVF